MGKRTKDRLPEKQSSLVSTFAPRNDKQHEMVKMIKDKEVVIAIGSSGTGKAQPLHSKVYTPNGPIMMRDIKIGQEVCTPNGNTAIVTKIFPQGIKDYYRIHFSDNTTADCCSEHL